MSGFNLLPWRERRRELRMRHWRRAGWLTVLLTCSACLVLQHESDAWLAQHNAQMNQRRAQLQALQAELTQTDLWQSRYAQAKQVQLDWANWQAQQWQAWQLVQQILSATPKGVQIERMVWRDQQLELQGWTLSEGHLQSWLSRLQVGGMQARDTKQRVQAAQWSLDDGLAAKRHPFSLSLSTAVANALVGP